MPSQEELDLSLDRYIIDCVAEREALRTELTETIDETNTVTTELLQCKNKITESKTELTESKVETRRAKTLASQSIDELNTVTTELLKCTTKLIESKAETRRAKTLVHQLSIHTTRFGDIGHSPYFKLVPHYHTTLSVY